MTDDTDSEADIELDSNIRANEEFASGLRLGLASELGDTGFEERDHYEIFGWPKAQLDNWNQDNWLALYLRNAYARIVIEKPAFTTWRDEPEIVDPAENADEPTDFESTVEKLAKNHNLWSHCERADRAAGIGQHGLLLIGFKDVADKGREAWETDASGKFSSPSDILTLKPVTQAQIEDIDYGDMEDGERWGKPVEYTIDLTDDSNSDTEDDEAGTIHCHHTRVVDIPATRPLDDETLTRPRAEPVLNNILDIEKILGAAAEAGYRAADYGLHLNIDPEKAKSDQGALDGLGDELEAYEHDLQRYIRTSGVDVERLGGDIQDPSGIVEKNLDAIAGQTGIPKKEFRGNESGEVSGAEADERSYFGMISERREQYGTPHIVRAVIETFRTAGIIPTPTAGEYRVKWPDLAELSAKDAADIESKRAQVIKAVPGLTGDTAMQYLKDGADALPDGEETPAAGELSERELSAQRETFDKVVGNADGPFSDIPVIPTGLEKLSKAWLIRWAEWIAAGRPDVKDVRQRANDWNPALHPRDPETGQFVERPFNLPDDAPDFGNMDTREVLSYIDDNGGGTLSETVLNPDSPVTVDGIPADASSLDDIGDGDTDAPDTDDGTVKSATDLNSFEELSPGDQIKFEDGATSGEIEEIAETDDGQTVAFTDDGFYTEDVVLPDDTSRDLTPEEQEIEDELGVDTANLSGLSESDRQLVVETLRGEWGDGLRDHFGDVGSITTETPDEELQQASAAYTGRRRELYINPDKFPDKPDDNDPEKGDTLLAGSKRGVIQHELAHARHFDSDPATYGDLRDRGLTAEERRLAESEVSDYGATTPHEFVAEVATGLKNGLDFDDEVLDLYEELNGPEVNT